MRRKKRVEKVDLSKSDRTEVDAMIASYEAQNRVEIPLYINDRLTIYVTPDKCNERYRQKYIGTHK